MTPDKTPADLLEVKKELDKMVAYGLLKYDKRMKTYIDADMIRLNGFSPAQRRIITRIIHKVEKYNGDLREKNVLDKIQTIIEEIYLKIIDEDIPEEGIYCYLLNKIKELRSEKNG